MDERSPFKYKKENRNVLEPEVCIEIDESLDPQNEKLGIFIYRFPAKSNTFIVNEFIELKKNGVDFHIYSLDRPSDEDLRMFEDKLHHFEDKITYLCETKLFNWGEFIKNNIPIGPNPIRRNLNDSTELAYDFEKVAIANAHIPLKNLIEDIQRRKVVKLYSPFANIGAEICMMLSYNTNIPYYFTAHSNDLFSMYGYEQLKIETASAIFTISEYNKNYILSKYDIDPDKIIVKRVNYLSPENIHTSDINHNYIFGAGRLIQMKGFEYSIRAFQQISNDFPDLHYYIAGSGPEKENILNLIAMLNLKDRVHLLGHIPNDQIISYIKGSTFTILTSILATDGDLEGIPTFFIESMSCGIPCIGSNYSGIPEIIESRKTGMLCELKDVDDISSNMKELIKLMDLNRDEISVNCKAQISKLFDNDKNSDLLLSKLQVVPRKKILLGGMPWSKDQDFDRHTNLSYGLSYVKDDYSEEFEFVYDMGKEYYGTNADRTDIDLCLAFHGNRECDYMQERFEYLDSISDNVWCIHNSYLKDHIIFDRHGYKGGSSLAIGDEELTVLDVTHTEAVEFVDSLYSKYITPNITDASPYFDEYIVFAGQMPDDSSISCAFPNETRLYSEIVIKALARLNKLGIPILYKPHPCMYDSDVSDWAYIQESTIWDLLKNGGLDNVHLVEDLNINDLIKNCSAVISICSGSAFEGLLHRKPVFNLGQSDLNCMIYKIEHFDELLDFDRLLSMYSELKDLDERLYSYVKQFMYPRNVETLYKLLKNR